MHPFLPFTTVWLFFTATVLAQSYPYRLDVIKSCTLWWNNDGDRTCADVRESLDISPEQFSLWNPSVGLNCDNWIPYTSYCIGDESENPDLIPSTTSSTSTTSTPIPSAKPSPASWDHLGCYPVGEIDFTSLDKRVTVIPNNTPAKCQDACYKVANTNYRFAGMAAGSQCWCSTFLRNAPSVNGTVDCSTSCAGDTTKTCGGAKFVDVYEADFSELSEETSTVSEIATVTISSVVVSSTVTPTSDSSASSLTGTQLWLLAFGSGLAGYLLVL